MDENLQEAERAIRVLQEHAKELGQRFGSGSVEERALFLVTEVGELVREVLCVTGLKRPALDADIDAIREQAQSRLGLEIYDAIWNLCDLATRAEIDLGSALRTKAEINRQRTW